MDRAAPARPPFASCDSPENNVPKTHFTSVDEYLATQPPAARAVLERMRSAIRRAVPNSVERISYRIPSFKLPGGAGALYFAGWKEHVSFYPASERLVAEFRDELAPFDVSKGTIRFPLARRVPVVLIGRLAKFRAQELVANRKSKSAAPKKRKAAARTKAGSRRTSSSR